MRKFVIHSKKDKSVIFEVEVEIISAMEDLSVTWLPAGEYKARIIKPDLFHSRVEKTIGDKKEFVLEPAVWYQFAFYDSLELAQIKCAELIRKDFEFNQRKHQTSFSEEDVLNAIATIEVISLPV